MFVRSFNTWIEKKTKKTITTTATTSTCAIGILTQLWTPAFLNSMNIEEEASVDA